ncbi:hypothetical protein PHPALM_29699 [Phytophthora palmivora]|uniref:Uncharacterized protein n=1 Tax=Phytophthora palmivora TaxID=4796 RepID=A0A2P4X6X1_9STRA|nr:hypothetical protein PHPALM_29699 [Phytophthora palmivora]
MFPLFDIQLFSELVGLVSIHHLYFIPCNASNYSSCDGAFAIWCLVSIFCALMLTDVNGQTKSELGRMLEYAGAAFNVVRTKYAAFIPGQCVHMILITIIRHGCQRACVLLSCVQLVVYCIYRPNPTKEVTPFQQHETSKSNVFFFLLTVTTMSNSFSAALNVAAAIGQVILSLSPVPDIYKVHCNRDIGEMAALPLVAMAVNNHLWYVRFINDNNYLNQN